MSVKCLQLEKAGFQKFMRKHKASPKGQRLGQAFYHHYNLHRLSKQVPFHKLFELDGDEAVREINRLVEFS